jgi:hypothetical protein
MEKSLEQIKDHLEEVGYTKSALKNIRFYLLGKGLIEDVSEIDDFTRGQHEFQEFLDWFKSDTPEKSLFDDVITIEKDGNSIDITIGELVDILSIYDNNKAMCDAESPDDYPLLDKEISETHFQLRILEVLNKMCDSILRKCL